MVYCILPAWIKRGNKENPARGQIMSPSPSRMSFKRFWGRDENSLQFYESISDTSGTQTESRLTRGFCLPSPWQRQAAGRDCRTLCQTLFPKSFFFLKILLSGQMLWSQLSVFFFGVSACWKESKRVKSGGLAGIKVTVTMTTSCLLTGPRIS